MDSQQQDITLSIVIVNYKTPQLVIDCLESLLPELELLAEKSAEPRVVVVDNASGDESMLQLQQWWQRQSEQSRNRIHFRKSPINGGFAAGNNLGISAQPAKCYLLLNSDTIVRPNSIYRLLCSMQEQGDVGLMGPRLEFLDGHPQESCFRDQGAISEFLRGAQLTLAARIFKHKVVAIPIGDSKSTIHWTSFACVMIRSEVFKKVGLMDEKYFMYFEDSEFCARARKAGWQIGHEPRARVVHLRGGSSSVKRRAIQKKRLPAYFYQSRARYLMHRGGWLKLAAANCLWVVGRALCQSKRLFGKPADGAAEREWRDLWTMPE